MAVRDMQVLKAKFVDSLRAQNGSFRDLNGVLFHPGIDAAGEKREIADPGSLVRGIQKSIAANDGVVRINRVVDAGVDVKAAMRRHHGLTIRRDVQVIVENSRVDYRVIVHFAAFDIEKEGTLLAQRATDVPAVLPLLETRFIRCERIARVEDTIAKAERSRAVKLIGAGFGEDLDAAEAEPVVFR